MLVVSIIIVNGSKYFSEPNLLDTYKSPQFINVHTSKFICKSTAQKLGQISS